MKQLKLIIAALLLFAPFAAQFASADVIAYNCADCPTNIGPDPQIITSTITVVETGTIDDLTIFIDFFHSWVGDLKISLMHNATTVVLLDGPDNTNGADYLGGTYGPLGDFAGSELSGDWTLRVEDFLVADEGTLKYWSMSGNHSLPNPQPPANAVPEPGTLALLGLGLAGMGMTRRKKKV